jgi:pimeloyl-ACP methyl ester carboxylesterase
MNRWLLLRGLGRDSRHWGSFPERLHESLGPIDLLTPDLPGNGRRNGERSPPSVAAVVEDCRARLPPTRVREPLNLIALSLGGMVALDWATRYPSEIARCVLINTSLAGISPFHQRLQPGQYPTLLRLVLGMAPDAAEARVLAMTSAQCSPQTLLEWTRFRRERPVARGNLLRQVRAAAAYRAPPAAPPLPVLLLASKGDRLVDVACSRAIARCYGWPLFVHGSAGHDLPLDDGRWVAEQVRHWCADGAPHPG